MKKSHNNSIIRNIALNGIMLALIIALQAVNLPNIITGILINSILIFITIFIGVKNSIILCLLSPFGALITGHLPPFMHPVLPAIALGNLVMIFVYNRIMNKPIILRILIPSIFKAVIIGVVGFILVHTFIPNKISNYFVFSILGFQFFTALPGIWLGIELSKKIIKID